MNLKPASVQKGLRFELLESFSSTSPWLEDVCNASDAHRNELGFLPRSVYEQFARRDGLYVLLAHTGSGQQYAGHLLFDRRFPRAHVRQIFTLNAYRRHGAASKLLDHLREALTRSCFISIRARVAEDLTKANAFWQRQGFYVQRSEKGGATKERQILVRCYELDSPQLFPTSGLSEDNPLGLDDSIANELPMYLLDMNVLFDVQPRRLRRAEVIGLFQAERMNLCRLAISNEVRVELKRNLGERKTDPMEAYIDTFPCLPVSHGAEVGGTFLELAELIFPHARGLSALKENERSDLHHVITAIRNDLAGLITNDSEILAVAHEIERDYGIQVLSSNAFELDESVAKSEEAFEVIDKNTLRLLSVSTDDESSVRTMLGQKTCLSGSSIAASWLPTGVQSRIAKRCAVWSDSLCIGYVTWSVLTTNDSMTVVRAAVDESHPDALEAARIILLYVIDCLRICGPCQIRMELPSNQSYIREVGASVGFIGSSKGKYLIKSIMGLVLMPSNWSAAQAALVEKGGPSLPNIEPVYNGPDQQILVHTPDGNRVHVSLDRLESLLAPTLFGLPGRPVILSPVRRSYAEPLLGHSRQGSLLPQASVSIYADRLYLSQPRSLKHFKRGTLMFFYETGKDGGRSQIVAVARVRESYLKSRDAFKASDLRQSVLTTSSLTDIGKSMMKTVAVFDNIFPLPNPVDLKVLQHLGCGRPNDVITTRPISDKHAQILLSEGFSSGK